MSQRTAANVETIQDDARAVKPRTEIGLGDVAQALDVLQPVDPALRQEIYALLGLHEIEPAPARNGEPESISDDKKAAGDPTQQAQPMTETTTRMPARRTARSPKPPPSARPLRYTVQFKDERKPESIPAWFAGFKHDQRESAASLAPAPMQQLIPESYVRAVLSRLLATPIPEGVVEVEALVDIIARGQPVKKIPRSPIPSLRQGVQVLVDINDAMDFFSDDQDYLLAHIEDLVGEDNLMLLWFDSNPLNGVYSESGDRQELYKPPPHGSKVILLTDLGIGRWIPQAPMEGIKLWRQFARLVHEADAQLLALVPYAPWRWPSGLRGRMPILYWEQFWSARRPWRRAVTPESEALLALIDRNPQALELAKFLSLAARIDRPLLRAARLKQAPRMEAGAEADLWTSPIAQSRSAYSILLAPGVARELRQMLASDGKEALWEAWKFLAEFRQKGGVTYDTRQEEYMNYLALHPDHDEVEEATELLREALAALVNGGEQRLDVARWALRAIPRLPDTVRGLPVAGELYYAAAVRLGVTPADESALPQDLDSVDWLTPAEAGRTTIGVQLIEGGLKFSRQIEPDMAELQVKDATPILLDVSWPAVIDSGRQQVALGPGGKFSLGAASCHLVSVSDDGTIVKWQVSNGRELALYDPLGNSYQCMAVSPNGRMVAGGDRQGSFTLWNLQTSQELFRQERDASPGGSNIDIGQQYTNNANIGDVVGSDVVGGDVVGGDVVSGDMVGGDKVSVDMISGDNISFGDIRDQGIVALAFSSDGRYLAAAEAGNDVQIWRIFGTRPQLFTTLGKPATALVFDPRNHNLMTGDQDGRVTYWDLSSHENRDGPVTGEDLLYEATDAERLGFSVERQGAINALAFIFDGQRVVSGDQNGQILLWRVDPPTLWSGYNGRNGAVSSFVFGSGSRQLVVGSNDSLTILDVEINDIRERDLREIPAFSLAFSPDGRYLFAGQENGAIRVLDSTTLEEKSTISGHNLIVSGLTAFSPPATTFTINTGEGRQYTISPDQRALIYEPLLDFDQLIDGSRRSQHPEVDSAINAIDEWLDQPLDDPDQPRRAFLVTGGPASGKSTLTGTLAEMSRSSWVASTYHNLRPGMLAALHICDSSRENTLDARTFVISLATQIAEYLPEFGERLYAIGRRQGLIPFSTAEVAEGRLTIRLENLNWQNVPAAVLLQEYLVGPLAALQEEEYFDQLLILVSDLHKAAEQTPTTGESLLPLLPLLSQLPHRVRFIFTSRAHTQVMAALAPLEPMQFSLSPEQEQEQEPEATRDSAAYIAHFQQFLLSYFDLEELKTLLFMLGIDYEQFAFRTNSELVQQLILNMEQVGRLAELEAEVRRQRPNAPWPADLVAPQVEPEPASIDVAERDTWTRSIYEFLTTYFNVSELQELCFDLEVEYEDLPGRGKSAKARELIRYLDRRDRLSELEDILRERRPNVPWPDFPPTVEAASSTRATGDDELQDQLPAIQQLLIDHFSEAEIRVLCFDLGIDYEDLPARDKQGKVRDLLAYLYRAGRLVDLIALASRERPSAPWPELPPTPTADSSAPAEEIGGLRSYRMALRQLLVNHFSEADIKTLCYDLDIDYDDLRGASKQAKIIELLMHMERTGRLEELVEEVRRQRPNVAWPDRPAEPAVDTGRPPIRPDLVFVNREAELELFEAMLNNQTDQRILLIHGEPGMGKSMLLSVMFDRLVRDYPDVMPAKAALRSELPVTPEMILRELEQALGGTANFPNFNRAITEFAEESNKPESWRFDRQIGRAFSADLYSLARERTAVVIFLDNYEYLTQQTREWVAQEMLTWTKGFDKLLFVIAGRDVPESVPPWSPIATVVSLSRLSPADVGSYLDRMQVHIDPEQVDMLYKASGGNPVELQRMVTEILNSDRAA